jgi:hypothetical protein
VVGIELNLYLLFFFSKAPAKKEFDRIKDDAKQREQQEKLEQEKKEQEKREQEKREKEKREQEKREYEKKEQEKREREKREKEEAAKKQEQQQQQHSTSVTPTVAKTPQPSNLTEDEAVVKIQSAYRGFKTRQEIRNVSFLVCLI